MLNLSEFYNPEVFLLEDFINNKVQLRLWTNFMGKQTILQRESFDIDPH